MSETLDVWTIHHNQAGPGVVVVLFSVDQAGKMRQRSSLPFDTVEDARAALAPGLVRFPRDPTDHPSVIESWL